MNEEWEYAVNRGDVDHIRRLFRQGVDINSRDQHGQTALMIAAKEGRINLVRFLVDNGAELEHTAKYKLTALMLAVVNKHVDVVRLLVAAGADLEIEGTGAPGFDGKTAMDLAVEINQSDLVDALRQTGKHAS